MEILSVIHLRRVLLSSLEGYAITSIKIAGVNHEFSTIKGVIEDVTEIVLNIKQVRLKRVLHDADAGYEKIYISIKIKINLLPVILKLIPMFSQLRILI